MLLTKRRIFAYTNMFLPLALGCYIYLMFRDDYFIAFYTERIPILKLLRSYLYVAYIPQGIIDSIFMFHFTDFLWAYSLEWSVLLSYKNKIKSTFYCLIFCTIMEILQIWPRLRATFDFWDIISQVIGVIFGFIMYTKVYQRIES